jgi:predicted Rdx family selenoprotein
MANVVTALPRVTIEFCTQCKWMLRAAYVSFDPPISPSLPFPPCKKTSPPRPHLSRTRDITSPPLPPRIRVKAKLTFQTNKFAQELISTFSTSLGEVALQPSTGGVFAVHLYTAAPSSTATIQKHLLWDRKAEGGFPGMYLTLPYLLISPPPPFFSHPTSCFVLYPNQTKKKNNRTSLKTPN